jgi:TPR repeat protein
LLSAIYLNRNSGITNDKKAFRWAKFSAEDGVPLGAAMLAVVNARGVEVARNPNEGARWARIAAEQGEPTGMFLLGEAYESGAGVSCTMLAISLCGRHREGQWSDRVW